MPRPRKPVNDTATEVSQQLDENGNPENVTTGADYVNGVAATNFEDGSYPTRATVDSGTDYPSAIGESKPGKRRGPKPGTKRKAKFNPAEETLKSNLAIDKLTDGVAFIHFMLSKSLKIDELNMGTDEAGALVVASLDVMKEYDLTPDPKTAAWMNLVMVSATVYGTRIMAYQNRMKLAKNQTVETDAS